jgi:hypothetical protein
MAVQEPSGDSGLWPRVKALTGWPDTNEDIVRQLGTSWDDAAAAFQEASRANVDVSETWQDGAGTAFQDKARTLLTASGQTEQGMQQVSARANGFAADVERTKTAIKSLIEANDSLYLSLSTMPLGAIQGFQDHFVGKVAAEINQFVDDMASKISADGTVLAGQPGSPGAPPAPPAGGSPAANKAWWDSLSDADKAKVLTGAPDSIRNLDGIPATIRDTANRSVLDRESNALTARKAEIERERATPGGRKAHAHEAELNEINGKLEGLKAIQARLNDTGPGKPPAFLLGLDIHDDGKALVAAGNPDTAANVTSYVPGTTADLATIGGYLNQSDVMWDAARQAGSPSTSVVTWLGYDAPDTIPHAGDESYADGGKAALDNFQDGLRATHQGMRSHNTVLGHSYGTTTIGHAARDGGLDADDLVFVASPGVGTNDVSGLHLDGVNLADVGSRVHSTVATNDIIQITNERWLADVPSTDIALGPDPARPEFGGQTFESAPGSDFLSYPTAAAHGEYWDKGNPAVDNMGKIIADSPH